MNSITWLKQVLLKPHSDLNPAVLTCSSLKKVTFYIIQTHYSKPLLVETSTASTSAVVDYVISTALHLHLISLKFTGISN